MFSRKFTRGSVFSRIYEGVCVFVKIYEEGPCFRKGPGSVFFQGPGSGPGPGYTVRLFLLTALLSFNVQLKKY